jgi:hypothetical protein
MALDLLLLSAHDLKKASTALAEQLRAVEAIRV